MALKWFDGFESYTDYLDVNALIYPVAGNAAGGDGCLFSSDYGRNGNGMKMADWNHVTTFTLLSAPSSNTHIMGVALYLPYTGTPTSQWNTPSIALYDGSGTKHVSFHLDENRDIDVYDGANSVIATTSGVSILSQAWYYIEIKAIIDDSVGQIVIKVNGTNILTTTADKDTLNGSNAYVQKVYFSGAYGIANAYWDDFYWLDGSGDAPHNDFLGDIRVDVLRPNGAGSHTEFTPSAGSNYQNVDETPGPDDDTTYNDGDTTNDEDSYALGNLPAPSGTTIYGVKSQITARKTDAGDRKCKVITRSGGSDYLGAEISLLDSFQTMAEIDEDNPDDSSAWEDADVNGMEVGIKVTA